MSPSNVLAVSVVRLGIAAVWALSPPLLSALAIREWWRSRSTAKSRNWRAALPPILAIAVLLSWISFLTFLLTGQIGGFGTHFITARPVEWFVLPSLVLTLLSFVPEIAKGKLILASFLVFGLWAGSLIVA